MSKSAREREQAIAAAEDAGDAEYLAPDEDEAADAVPVGSLSKEELGGSGVVQSQEPQSEEPQSEDDSDGPEVKPEDVEARLAEADAAEEAEDSAEDDEADTAADEEE